MIFKNSKSVFLFQWHLFDLNLIFYLIFAIIILSSTRGER